MARVPLKAGLLSTIDPGGDPRLIAAKCRACRQLHFPATATCPYCSGGDCESTELSKRGALLSYTAVEKAPPGYRGKVPYGFGVVELPEGIRLITRLTESRIDRLTFGLPVRLALEEICVDDGGNQVIGWAFEPDPSTSSG